MDNLNWTYNPNRRIHEQVLELEDLINKLNAIRRESRLLIKRQYWHRNKHKIRRENDSSKKENK